MSDVRTPKLAAKKTPHRIRKPSRPLDGVNHRLLREQKAAEIADHAHDDDSAPPTRKELEGMASELGIKFDGRTSDRKLAKAIDDALKK
jgi:hypothetical protein